MPTDPTGPGSTTTAPVSSDELPRPRAGSGPSRGAAVIVGVLVVALVGIVWGIFRQTTGTPGPSVAGAAGGPAVSAQSIEAALQTAASLQREKKFADASALLNQLLTKAPGDQAVRVAYAQSLIGQGRLIDALEQYESAIAIGTPASKQTEPATAQGSSDQSSSRLRKDPALAALHFESGTIASSLAQVDKAREHYQSAQVLDPVEPRYPLFLAMVQIRLGDEPAASASLLRAVKLNPDLAEGWGTLAELALKQNRLGLAEQHLDNALRLQPEVARWRVVKARILNRQNKPEQAAQVLTALDPSQQADRQVVTLLGETFGLMGKPDEAARAFARAVEASPSDPELNYQAAVWHQKIGDRAKATAFARTAAALGNQPARDLLDTLASAPAQP